MTDMLLMTAATSLVHNPNSNQPGDQPGEKDPLKVLLNDVREYGRDSAAGKDALPKLALRVLRAAADGVIGTDPDTDGRDDASRIYEEYTKAESKKAIHDHTTGGVKANVSKLRKIVQMGVMTTCDPVEVASRAVLLRQEMAKTEKVAASYPALVSIARTQLDNDTDLSDDQIRGCIRKKVAPDKEVLDELKAIEKRLERLITGEGKVGMDQHEETLAAHEAVKRRISVLMVQQQRADLILKAAELGIVIPDETTDEVEPEDMTEAMANYEPAPAAFSDDLEGVDQAIAA